MVKISIFGYGNVGKKLARYALQTGAQIIHLADSNGIIYKQSGFTQNDLDIAENSSSVTKINLPDSSIFSVNQFLETRKFL